MPLSLAEVYEESIERGVKYAIAMLRCTAMLAMHGDARRRRAAQGGVDGAAQVGKANRKSFQLRRLGV